MQGHQGARPLLSLSDRLHLKMNFKSFREQGNLNNGRWIPCFLTLWADDTAQTHERGGGGATGKLVLAARAPKRFPNQAGSHQRNNLSYSKPTIVSHPKWSGAVQVVAYRVHPHRLPPEGVH